MEMPQVSKCSASDCAYNTDMNCHALAITIGDTADPHCDTFFSGSAKGGSPNDIGRVGACKVSVCKHNEHLECQASSIEVGKRDGGVYCMTFSFG